MKVELFRKQCFEADEQFQYCACDLLDAIEKVYALATNLEDRVKRGETVGEVEAHQFLDAASPILLTALAEYSISGLLASVGRIVDPWVES